MLGAVKASCNGRWLCCRGTKCWHYAFDQAREAGCYGKWLPKTVLIIPKHDWFDCFELHLRSLGDFGFSVLCDNSPKSQHCQSP